VSSSNSYSARAIAIARLISCPSLYGKSLIASSRRFSGNIRSIDLFFAGHRLDVRPPPRRPHSCAIVAIVVRLDGFVLDHPTLGERRRLPAPGERLRTKQLQPAAERYKELDPDQGFTIFQLKRRFCDQTCKNSLTVLKPNGAKNLMNTKRRH